MPAVTTTPVYVRTYQETKTTTTGFTGWTDFVNLVSEGNIRLLTSRRAGGIPSNAKMKTQDRMARLHDTVHRQAPTAAAIPANWLTEWASENPGAPLKIHHVGSRPTRQDIGPMCEGIHANPNHAYVVSHRRRGEYTRKNAKETIRAYDGNYDTIALVPLPWLAEYLGTTVAELEQAPYETPPR